MNSKLKLIILITFIGLFQSCLKEVEIDVDGAEPVPVLSAFATDGEFIAEMYWTKKYTDDPDFIPWINNAQMSLDINGDSIVYAEFLSDGQYKFTANIDVNDALKINVHIPEYGDLQAETIMPYKPACSEPAITSGYTYSLDAEIKILDDENHDDKYLVEASFFSKVNSTFVIDNTPYTGGEYNSIRFNYCGMEVFSDETFNGGEYLMEYGAYSECEPDSSRLEFNVRSINYDMYEHFLSIKKQVANTDDYLGSTIPVYSNVENGTGIFGGYFEVTKSVDFVWEKE